MANISSYGSPEIVGAFDTFKTPQRVKDLISLKALSDELDKILADIKGSDFEPMLFIMNRVYEIKSILKNNFLIKSDTSVVEVARPLMGKVNTAELKLAEVWKNAATKIISGFKLDSASRNPRKIKDAIAGMTSVKETMLNLLTRPGGKAVKEKDPVRVGINVFNNAIMNAENNLTAVLNLPPDVKYDYDSDLYTHPGNFLPGFDNGKEEEGGMGLGLPIALGAGALGLILAFR